MPSYKAKEDGFFNGQLYGPGRKRTTVITDKPLKPVPTWLEEVKGETAAEAKARRIAEKKVAEEAKKKAASDKVEIDSVTFIEGPAPTQPGVETL